MAEEIERKYLINEESAEFKELISKLTGVIISQGYLNSDPTKIVRVRQKGEEGYITIKGKQVGIRKAEYEYQIPLEDVRELMLMCDIQVDKIRFTTPANSVLIWEIDIFKGINTGLFVAEIELKNEDNKFDIPEWIGKEVSEDVRFANSNLANHPYQHWSKEEKEEINIWKKQNTRLESIESMQSTVKNSHILNKNEEISSKVKKLL